LLRLTAALAEQDPAVTLVLDDVHMLREPEALKELDFVLRNAGPDCESSSPRGWIRCCRCIAYRVAGQLARSGPATLAFSAAEASLLLAERCGALLRMRWTP
jgi:ATP/maltotriose-dependent transcriptional regulator MalT